MGRNTPGSQVLVAQVSSGPACFSAAGQGHRGANIPVGAAATRLAETATRRMSSFIVVGRSEVVVECWWCSGREVVFSSKLENKMDRLVGKPRCFYTRDRKRYTAPVPSQNITRDNV